MTVRATLLVAVLVAVGLAAGPYPPLPANLERAAIDHVNDGDTVVVRMRGRKERVRLIGVDCPELHDSPKLDRQLERGRETRAAIVARGAKASAFTERALAGRDVLLEYDVDRRDRHGRRLAYVWLSDGTLFNGELLREGWARVLTIPPNVRYSDLFIQLQRDARKAGRGLWARQD